MGILGLRVTESQNYRVTDTQGYSLLSIWVGEHFLCLISINSPTRFARRWIIKLLFAIRLFICPSLTIKANPVKTTSTLPLPLLLCEKV